MLDLLIIKLVKKKWKNVRLEWMNPNEWTGFHSHSNSPALSLVLLMTPWRHALMSHLSRGWYSGWFFFQGLRRTVECYVTSQTPAKPANTNKQRSLIKQQHSTPMKDLFSCWISDCNGPLDSFSLISEQQWFFCVYCWL